MVCSSFSSSSVSVKFLWEVVEARDMIREYRRQQCTIIELVYPSWQWLSQYAELRRCQPKHNIAASGGRGSRGGAWSRRDPYLS